MRKRIIPVVLMSLSIVAAACGSDDEAASTTAPAESTAPDETTAATTADSAVAGSDTTVAGGTGECTLDTPLKIGFAADLAFGAIQMAGSAMGMGSGFESSRIFNPALGEAGSSFDQIFVMTASMIFLAIDGHHFFLIALQKTFNAVPLNGALPFNGMEAVMETTAVFISAGIHMAMPVMAALVLTDLTLGLLARVAPQVQVYFLGLPVKVVVALAAMGMTFAVIVPSLTTLFKSMAESMFLFVK